MSNLGKIIKPSLFILVMMVSIGPFGDTEYVPSLPKIASSLHVVYSLVQLTMTSYLLGYAVSQLFYGPLSDRFGRKPIMIIGAGIFVIGSFLCVSSETIWQLIGGRFLQAVGACAGGILSSACIRDAFDEEERGHIFAKVNAAFAVAPGVGPIVGSFVDHLFGWHANFLILLVLSALLLIAVIMFLPETNLELNRDALRPTVFVRNYASLLKDPYYIAYLVVMGLCIGVVYSALIGAPDLVITILRMPSWVVVIIALGVLIGFIVGSVSCNYLIGRISGTNLILIGLMIMIAGSLIMALLSWVGLMSTFLWASLVPIMIVFAGIAFIIPISMSNALEPFKHVAGSASAMLGFFQMGLASLSTGVMSIIHADSTFDLPFMFCVLSLLATVVFILAIQLRPNRARYYI